MALFNKFNKSRIYDIDTEGFEGRKAKDVYSEIGNKPLLMRGLFINHSDLGDSVSVVTNKSIIYFGGAMVETAEEIMQNDECTAVLNSTGVAFHIEEFTSKKYKRTGYKFVFEEETIITEAEGEILPY